MNAGELVARLQAAARKLEEARSKASAAAQDATEARTLVAGALEGVSAGQLVAVIDKVRESLSQAAGTVAPAQQQVRETISRVQALGN